MINDPSAFTLGYWVDSSLCIYVNFESIFPLDATQNLVPLDQFLHYKPISIKKIRSEKQKLTSILKQGR